MERYSVITQKQPREIALLKGSGCVYKKCVFCDYHLDSSKNADENFKLNREVLDKVTGRFGELEVINSGSVFELDENTLAYIKKVCREKAIKTIHFELHYLYKNRIRELRESFDGFNLKLKLGLETFDYDLRERVFKKGIPERDPEVISAGFDEANFLVGVSGQTLDGIRRDIELGLKYFERICVNVMCENSTPVKPDKKLIYEFTRGIYCDYRDNPRVDILINNTDFGVG